MGGHHFEVFSAQAKDPTSQWKVTGASGVAKEFDKTVKSFVFILNGSPATTKIQLPRDSNKQGLCLLQKYLVLQVFVPKGPDFCIDLGIQDLSSTTSKRYILLSTGVKEMSMTPLHTRLPLGLIKRDVWLNLVLDLTSLVGEAWKGQTYKSIESICLSANCRLRRIFTMRSQPPDTTNDDELFSCKSFNENIEMESIPKQCQLAPDVLQETQVINMTKLNYSLGKAKSLDQSSASLLSTEDLDLNGSAGQKSANADSYHIAFGRKVPMLQRKPSGKEGSSSNNKPVVKAASAKGRIESTAEAVPTGKDNLKNNFKKTTASKERKNSDPGSKVDDPEVTVDKGAFRVSKTWTDGADGKEEIPFVKPHPPPEPKGLSVERVRRKPRVKSAGKERTPHAFSDADDVHKYYLSPNSRKHQRSSSHGGEALINYEREPPVKIQLPVVIKTDEEVQSVVIEETPKEKENELPAAEDKDNLNYVINALRGVDLDERLSTPGEYQDTDDDSEEENDGKVYTYFSTPKSVQPRHNVRSKGRGSSHQNQQKKHRTKRRGSKDSHVTNGTRGPEPAADFQMTLSSEEEMSIRTKIMKSKPKPRPSAEVILLAPTIDLERSPGTSQPRRSISRKSLREIPKDDARLSQTLKPYDANKYQMDELSASYEKAMLESLKKQAMEEGMEDSEEGGKHQDVDRLHYGNDSMSSSSGDEDSRMMKIVLRTHNYQDEMKLDSARLNMDLNQSNPRDWGNLFSPPITLTANDTLVRTNTLHLSPNYGMEVSPKSDGDQAQTKSPQNEEEAETDGEEELDLLYDPVLNCYFDPRTKIYYELV